MFLLIVWIVGILLFILIPFLSVPDNRRRIYYRVTLLKWNVEEEVAQANAAADASAALARNSIPAPGASAADGDSDRNFHYVLSRAQEDEIRDSFLTEKLQKYTFTLSLADIQRLRSDTMATTASTSNGSGADAAVPIDSYGDENEADLEAAAAAAAGSIFQPPNDSSLQNVDVVKKGTATTEDCCSSDDGLSDDDGLMLEMDEFFDDSSMIILPNMSGGGVGKSSGNNNNATTVRQVPNGCAICLTSMDVNDRITFSSDPKCNHIFHEQCMMDWLVASGRKFLKRQRREERNSSTTGSTLYRYNCQNPIEKILSFPMQCPCCRQPFVRTVDDEDDDDSLAKPSPTPTATTTVTDPPVATSSNESAVQPPVEDVESPPPVQVTADTANNDDVRGSQRTSIAGDETSLTTTIAVGSDDEYY